MGSDSGSSWLPHRLIVNPSAGAAGFKERASLPAAFCSTCNALRTHPSAALPEAQALPDGHPFLLKLRKLRRDLDRRAKPLQPGVGRARDLTSIPGQAFVQHARALSVERDEFEGLVQELRELLELPAAREVRPGCRLGHLQVKLARPLRVLDGASFLWVLLRREVVDLLEQHGITGWVAAPVHLSGARAAIEATGPVVELVVTGRAGPPLGQAGARRCAECGHIRAGDDLFEFLVDPAQHDGSDIFRFDGDPRIFVTARLREVFEAAGYATEDANHVSMVDFRHGY